MADPQSNPATAHKRWVAAHPDYFRRWRQSVTGKAAQKAGHKRWWKKEKVKRRAWLDRQKAGKPCADCGKVYPLRRMQWHHVRGPKLFNVGRAVTVRRTLAAIEQEIAKCIVLCIWCHKKRHPIERDETGLIKSRTPAAWRIAAACAICQRPFTKRRPHQRFCSVRCRWDAANQRRRI